MFPVTPQIVALWMQERRDEASGQRLASIAGATRRGTRVVDRVRAYFRPAPVTQTCPATCQQ